MLLALATLPALADNGTEPVAASGAAAAPAASGAAATAPAEPDGVDADCGCKARSPAQLLETQRQMADPAAEPGS